jgi:hypothetical protein
LMTPHFPAGHKKSISRKLQRKSQIAPGNSIPSIYSRF